MDFGSFFDNCWTILGIIFDQISDNSKMMKHDVSLKRNLNFGPPNVTILHHSLKGILANMAKTRLGAFGGQFGLRFGISFGSIPDAKLIDHLQ